MAAGQKRRNRRTKLTCRLVSRLMKKDSEDVILIPQGGRRITAFQDQANTGDPSSPEAPQDDILCRLVLPLLQIGERTNPNEPNAVNSIGMNKMLMELRKRTHGGYHPLYQSLTEILGLKSRKYGWAAHLASELGERATTEQTRNVI
jgi:hypothetical protein